jgi:hypothetical protein
VAHENLDTAGGFRGGLTGRKAATKISLVGCLLWRFGRDDEVSDPVEYYQETILFLLTRRDEPWH